MPNKCAVFGCYTGYSSNQSKPLFHFPNDNHKTLQDLWVKFLNRENYIITPQSCVCIDHFEEKYIIQHPKRQRLIPYRNNPIPTINPDVIPLSLTKIPTLPRNASKKSIFQEEQLKDFKIKYQVNDLDDVKTYLKSAPEYDTFHMFLSEGDLTVYKIQVHSGIAKVQECINIDSELRVKLSFEGLPIPLPEYIRNSANCKLTSLDMLTNLLNYCRNYSGSHDECDIEVIQELLKSTYFHRKGRPKYSHNTLRFALLMRYTSNSAYRFLKQYLPLPSETVLTQLKSPSFIAVLHFVD